MESTNFPKDAQYFAIGKEGDRTVLLGMKTTQWRGGILSLTYLGDITTKEVKHLEACSIAQYGADQGTGECELIIVRKTFIPTSLCMHMKGNVGILRIPPPGSYDIVALLIDSAPLQDLSLEKMYFAVYWLHFNFE